MSKITVQENQTIMDVAIQSYGNQYAVFAILEDNPAMLFDGLQIDKPLIAGQELSIREQDDLIKRNIKQDLSDREVTSHVKTDAPNPETIGNYLVDSFGGAIVDENGNFILTPM